MNLFLTLAFLFFVGSVTGWVLELVFRRFFSSANPERKWINPGFCTGPYVPLYGFGLCIMFLIASMEQYQFISNPVWNKLVLFLLSAVAMTVIEYIAGIFCLKVAKVRLWDYSDQWGNIQGIICPKFSFFWAVLGACYAYLIHPHILNALNWLSHNLAFSFVIGLFFGVFLIDVAHSTQVVVKLKKFAEDNNIVVRYENIKAHIRSVQDKTAQKHHFFRPFGSERPLNEHLKDMLLSFEKRKTKHKKKHKDGDES